MERRILKGLSIIALIVLVISTIASQLIYYNFHENNIKENLNNIAQILHDSIDNMTEQETISYFRELNSLDEAMRITYINKDGKVLFDSMKKTDENHSNRPEFKEAEKFGASSIKRYSHTISQNTYYIALSLENNNVIRIAMQTNNMAKTFFKVLQVDFLISIVIFLISIYLSKYATKRIIEPLNKDNFDIENLSFNELPELSPFIHKIKTQNKIIKKQMNELEKEKNTIETILQQMPEGIIIIDKDEEIILMNKASEKILRCEINMIKKNYRHLTFNEDLIRSIENAYNKKEEEGILEISDRNIKYLINYIEGHEDIEGVVVLLIDETEEEKMRKIKDDFSANVSHELKTPITSIYGFSEMLKNNMISSEKDREDIINMIYSESKRMLSLIEDIIRISQLEDTEEIKKEKINIKEITQKVIESLKIESVSKNISLKVEGDAIIMSNETMIWEMLVNLIGNAVKYNIENGIVNIKIRQDKEKAEIEITDTGIGISEEDQLRIFERFYRSDKSRSKKYGGTGLGLSIVKHIVNSLNGNIKLTSKLGYGTKITVKI